MESLEEKLNVRLNIEWKKYLKEIGYHPGQAYQYMDPTSSRAHLIIPAEVTWDYLENKADKYQYLWRVFRWGSILEREFRSEIKEKNAEALLSPSSTIRSWAENG